MLCVLNRGVELGVHIRGAVNNGASEVEVRCAERNRESVISLRANLDMFAPTYPFNAT